MTLLVRKVREVRLLCELIPFTCEHTSSAVLLKSVTDAADACEKVDESKRAVVVCRSNDQRKKSLSYGVFPMGRDRFTYAPPTQRALVDFQDPGNLQICVT